MPEISPGARTGGARMLPPGFVRTLITFTMLMLSGCDNANASPTARTYRPLHADCPTPPRVEVEAGHGTEARDLAAVMFFDEDQTLDDTDEFDEMDDKSENINPSNFNMMDGIKTTDNFHILLAEEDGEQSYDTHAPGALQQSDTIEVNEGFNALPGDDFGQRRGNIVEELLALEPAELEDAEHPGSAESAPHDHLELSAHAPASSSQHAEHDTRATETPSAAAPAAPAAEIIKIDINAATEAELTSIRGIGPALASRILDYRSRRRFTRLSHLKRVKGIGPATYNRLEPYITIGPEPDAPPRAGQN